jgi:hypothetical protein
MHQTGMFLFVSIFFLKAAKVFLKAFGNLMCMNYNPITEKEILDLFKPHNSQLNNDNNIMHEYEKI